MLGISEQLGGDSPILAGPEVCQEGHVHLGVAAVATRNGIPRWDVRNGPLVCVEEGTSHAPLRTAPPPAMHVEVISDDHMPIRGRTQVG